MKKLLALLVTALLLGTAAAAELPSEGELLLTADGRLVGTGEFKDGNLELQLLAGFSGFATMTVVDESGNEFSVEVMVNGDSEVVLNGTDGLAEAVEAEGGEVEITVHDELEAHGNMAFGAGVPDHVELPQAAIEGMASAEENHELAEQKAEEAQTKSEASAEARARGEASAGADGGADASAGVSVGVGGRL